MLSGQESGGHPNRWSILWIMCGSLVLVVVSVSSLNVAIPAIQRALNATGSELQWIVDSYALVFAGFLLPAGALGDRLGRRGVLLAGLVIFLGASAGGMVAGTPGELIAWRAAMGLGAALIMPATLSIVASVFPEDERPRAIAIWAGFAGAGGVVGLLASGLLLRSFWWGSIFAVNIPLVVVMILAVLRRVPSTSQDEATPLDPIGALLSIVGLSALVFAIIEGPERGWLGELTLGAFLVAIGSLVGFVVWELRATDPMLDPRFFANRRFSLGSLVITGAFFGIFGMFFVLTQHLQFVQQYDALAAGLRIMPYGIVLLAVAPRAAVLARRHGDRLIMVIGMVLASVGFFVLAAMLSVDGRYHYPGLAGGLVLVALGTGLLMPPATTALVASLPANKAGVGSAMNDTTREVGGTIGIAVGGALLSIGYRNSLRSETVDLDDETAELALDSLGSLLASSASSELVAAGRLAFTQGAQLAMIASALLLAGTAAIVWLVHPRGVATHDPKPQEYQRV